MRVCWPTISVRPRSERGPRDGAPEPIAIDRLQQVVHRLHVKGANGVIVVCGDEHHEGHRRGVQCPQHLESVTSGHADIEEEQIRATARYRGDRFTPRPAFADNLHTRILLEQATDTLASKPFIIHDHRAEGARLDRDRIAVRHRRHLALRCSLCPRNRYAVTPRRLIAAT